MGTDMREHAPARLARVCWNWRSLILVASPIPSVSKCMPRHERNVETASL